MLTALVIICLIVGALLYAHYNGSPWPGGRKFDLSERKPGETVIASAPGSVRGRRF